MLIKRVFLICLIVSLSSGCIHRGRGVEFKPSERPDLPIASWVIVEEAEEETLYCTDEPGAKILLNRELIRDTYEEELRILLNGCNKALGN